MKNNEQQRKTMKNSGKTKEKLRKTYEKLRKTKKTTKNKNIRNQGALGSLEIFPQALTGLFAVSGLSGEASGRFAGFV